MNTRNNIELLLLGIYEWYSIILVVIFRVSITLNTQRALFCVFLHVKITKKVFYFGQIMPTQNESKGEFPNFGTFV